MKRFLLALLLLTGWGASLDGRAATIDPDNRLSISDAAISEGNSPTREMVFTVSLPKPLPIDVSASFFTKPITAQANSDYVPQNPGQVVLKAGQTRAKIIVHAVGDRIEEGDESFLVQLGAPKRVGIADSDGIGRISDDDYRGQISVGDVSFVEGNSGSKIAKASVRFSQPPLHDIEVRYSTKNGTARPGFDYIETRGALLFKPGRLVLDVLVPVRGDLLAEANETFSVNLLVTGLVVQRPGAVVTILNDDGAIPAASGKIAFVSGRDGSNEIYVMNGDGSNQTRLTNNSEVEGRPALSRDGTKIAFETNHGRINGNYDAIIGIMNADGSDKRYLPIGRDSYGSFAPVFSPDGTKLLYRTGTYPQNQLTLVDLDGGGRVDFAKVGIRAEPDFSPDGSSVVFALEDNFDAFANCDLYRVRTDGSGLTRLTATPDIDERAPRFSPDGQTIVYQTQKLVAGTFSARDLHLMNADGTGQIALPNASFDDFRPGFSPDAARIAFVSTRSDQNQIYSMSAEASGQTALTSQGGNIAPSWSIGAVAPPPPPILPGSLSGQIAFTSYGRGKPDILVMNANGTNLTRLTQGEGNHYPRFSRDGKQLLFVSERDGTSEIYLMNADGTAQTRLTRTLAPLYSKFAPSFSPDGQKIIFSETSTASGAQTTQRSDIYVMNRDGSALAKISIAGGIAGEFNYADAAEFSPDGQKIAFSTLTAGPPYQGRGKIYMMNLDGSGATLLSTNTDSPYPCSSYYSPEGKSMVFSSGTSGNNEIYIMASDGSNRTSLTKDDADHRNESPCFSPDGTKIVYNSLETNRSQLCVMNADGTGKIGITPNAYDDHYVEPTWAIGSVGASSTAARTTSEVPSAGNS